MGQYLCERNEEEAGLSQEPSKNIQSESKRRRKRGVCTETSWPTESLNRLLCHFSTAWGATDPQNRVICQRSPESPRKGPALASLLFLSHYLQAASRKHDLYKHSNRLQSTAVRTLIKCASSLEMCEAPSHCHHMSISDKRFSVSYLLESYGK